MIRRGWPWLVGLALLGAGMIFALKIGGGSLHVSWGAIWSWATGGLVEERDAQVLAKVRLPRVIMAVLTGSILASAGVVYQALLRNPLADPYTLGVSGGATFGAVLAITFATTLGWNAYASAIPVISLAALGGAVLAVAAIYLIARSWGLFSTSTLILAGVTLNLVFGSMILLMQYFADYTQVYQMIRWMMGGLDVVGYRDFLVVGPVAAAGFALLIRHMRDLDLISVDPVTAASLGVRVEPVRRRLLAAASLMTGAVVAMTGPVGFVGLIVPHVVRLLTGAGHRRVLPGSMLLGALFLLACDVLAQNLLPSEELPVGVITSMVGGPFFVYLLLRSRRRGGLWMD